MKNHVFPPFFLCLFLCTKHGYIIASDDTTPQQRRYLLNTALSNEDVKGMARDNNVDGKSENFQCYHKFDTLHFGKQHRFDSSNETSFCRISKNTFLFPFLTFHYYAKSQLFEFFFLKRKYNKHIDAARNLHHMGVTPKNISFLGNLANKFASKLEKHETSENKDTQDLMLSLNAMGLNKNNLRMFGAFSKIANDPNLNNVGYMSNDNNNSDNTNTNANVKPMQRFGLKMIELTTRNQELYAHWKIIRILKNNNNNKDDCLKYVIQNVSTKEYLSLGVKGLIVAASEITDTCYFKINKIKAKEFRHTNAIATFITNSLMVTTFFLGFFFVFCFANVTVFWLFFEIQFEYEM